MLMLSFEPATFVSKIDILITMPIVHDGGNLVANIVLIYVYIYIWHKYCIYCIGNNIYIYIYCFLCNIYNIYANCTYAIIVLCFLV